MRTKSLSIAASALLIFLFANTGCKKDNPGGSSSATYTQVNLVSDTVGYGAAVVDPQLVNPWGIISNGTGGPFWIADNGTGITSIYTSTGTSPLAGVTIPAPGAPTGGAASGVVYNGTSDFGGNLFIYSTEDGTLAGWKSGTSCTIVADNSGSAAVFKGLALANDGTGNFLFVADFHNNKVDVFSATFAPVSGRSFTDPGIPSGFAPFNIQAIGGQLYVVYALQDGQAHDDVAGAGNGYISVFKYDGTFVKRFASQGTLNSPWGILSAPTGFGQASGSILVGNFGDGTINVFDASGNYQGQLKDNTSKVISIPGLWGIATASGSSNLFFTAGPGGESHGLYGYLKMN